MADFDNNDVGSIPDDREVPIVRGLEFNQDYARGDVVGGLFDVFGGGGDVVDPEDGQGNE